VERARDAPVDVAVHHLANADRAGALAERLRARLPGIDEMVVSEVGAVVGAHVGPGMLAVVVSPHR
jgi:fatty acid-binding protein DegV